MPIINPKQQQNKQQDLEVSQQPTAGADTGLKLAAIKPGAAEGGADGEKRTKNGKFTMAQLRQTDGIVPLQSGTNQYDSQRGKTGFGMPRNTKTAVEFGDRGKRWSVDAFSKQDNQIRLQSGTNQFDSQCGMTGFGCPRDVKGKHLKRIWELEFPEEAVTDQQAVNQGPQQQSNTNIQQQNAPQQRQSAAPQPPRKNVAGPAFH